MAYSARKNTLERVAPPPRERRVPQGVKKRRAVNPRTGTSAAALIQFNHGSPWAAQRHSSEKV